MQDNHPAEADSAPRQRPRARSVAQPISAAEFPDALLKIATVAAITGRCESSIFGMTAAGKFPEPIRMGTRCTRWRAGDVKSWLVTQANSGKEPA